MIRRTAAVLTVLAAFAPACGGESEALDPVPQVAIDLPANVWRRAVVVAPVAIAPLDIVTEIALEVDGVHVADIDPSTLAPPAPMTISWDSTTVGDGEHTLRVVATTATGRSADDSVTFLTDNTPPTITLVGQSATETPIELQFAVTENESGVWSAALRWGSFDSAAIDPVTWRATVTGCIAADMQASVNDRVGNTGTVTFRLDAVDSCDRDCDDVPSVGACGGADCNDALRWIPSPDDNYGNSLDENCDGVDGTDVDGDGVPGSTGFAAPDCNDASPSIHGYFSNWALSPRLGAPRHDGIATIAAGDDRTAVLYGVMNGPTYPALDLVRRDATGAWSTPTRLTGMLTSYGAAAALDSSGNLHGAFNTTGGVLTYVSDRTGTLVTETVTTARLAQLALDGSDRAHLILEGSNPPFVRHARQTATGWEITSPWSLAVYASGSLFLQNGVLTYVHVINGPPTTIQIDRHVNDAWVAETVAASGATLLAAAPHGNDIVIMALGPQSRTHLFGGPFGAWPGVALPYQAYRSLTIGADGRVHVVLAPSSGLHATHHVFTNGVWYQEPMPYARSVAVDPAGRVSALVNSYQVPTSEGAALITEQSPVLPPADAVGDGVDQDCDGVDG